MGIRATVAAFAVLALAGGAVPAQDAAPESPAFEAALESARARLQLTPAQVEQLKPILRERNAALAAIRDKHALERSRRARRAMFAEAQPVVENYQARIRTILDEAQVAEWEAMRAEARARLKALYKQGGAPE